MPIPVVCPNGHHMTLPDKQAGKKYRCPLCLTYFEVPPAASGPVLPSNGLAAAIPPAAGAGHHVSAAPQGSPSATAPSLPAESVGEEAAAADPWPRVDRGLGFHYARLVVVMLSFLVAFSFVIGVDLLDSPLQEGLVLVFSGGLLVAAPLLGLIGSFLCLLVPRDTGARSLVLASYLLDLTALPLAFCYFTDQFTPQGQKIVELTGAGIQAVSWVLFIFFLRRLALFFDQQVAADEALALLVRAAVLVLGPWLVYGLLFLIIFVVPLLGLLVGPPLLVLPFVLIVLFILFLLRQLALIGTLRQVIRNRAQ